MLEVKDNVQVANESRQSEDAASRTKATGSKRKPTAAVSLNSGLSRETAEELIKSESTESAARPAKITNSKRKPTAFVALDSGLSRETAEELIKSETGEIEKPTADASQLRFSLQQPAWHVVVLMVATGKLYFIWWAYKTWRDLNAKFESTAPAQSDEALASRLSPQKMSDFSQVSPMLRALGLVIPYWNNYLLLTLAYGIAKLHPDKNAAVAKMPFISALIVMLVWITTSMLSILPEVIGGGGPWYLLFLTGAIPIAYLQHWLNRYWQSQEEDGALVRHGFSGTEIGILIAGSLYLGCIVASFIMGANK